MNFPTHVLENKAHMSINRAKIPAITHIPLAGVFDSRLAIQKPT